MSTYTITTAAGNEHTYHTYQSNDGSIRLRGEHDSPIGDDPILAADDESYVADVLREAGHDVADVSRSEG